jgi:hypothetical protein
VIRAFDGNEGAFVLFPVDPDLGVGDLDGFGVVVLDETRLPQAIDESFAAASEVVRVEQGAGSAFNADMSARAVSCLLRRYTDQC